MSVLSVLCQRVFALLFDPLWSLQTGHASHCRSVSCCLPVFPDLLSAIPTGLHVTVIFFCGVVTLFSSVATGFFFFNAFGRPYETLQGPVGLYLWTFITCENHTLTASPASPWEAFVCTVTCFKDNSLRPHGRPQHSQIRHHLKKG